MNNRTNPLNAYRETKVKTASQGRLIVMLYDEAIKQLDIAAGLLEQNSKQYDKVNNAIIKAQDIIAELMSSLNFDKGGDMARNLFNLYMFFNSQLMEANFQKKHEPIVSVRGLMAELRDAWQEISRMAVDNAPQVQRSLNVAG